MLDTDIVWVASNSDGDKGKRFFYRIDIIDDVL